MLLVAALALSTLVLGCVGLGLAFRPLTGPSLNEALPTLALTGCGLLVWLTLVSNAAGLFNVLGLLAAILVGAGIAVWHLRKRLTLATRPSPVLLASVAIVVVPILLLVFIPAEINLNDDGPAYLLFSEKMARLGSSGAEPFSERRLYGFGGQFGLVALINDVLGPRWLSLYEPGLGLALIGSWLLLAGRNEPTSALVRAALVMGLGFV